MPSAASALNPHRTDNHDDHNDAGQLAPEAHEMDTLPQAPTHGRSLSRTRSRILLRDDKVVEEPLSDSVGLGRRDYAIGILLLLSVVVLWTLSNFITQVSPTQA
jgi:hypothetical protein